MNQAVIRAVLLDMDGVLYHGMTPLPGAPEFIQRLQLPCVFITNNPILPASDVASKLQQLGFARPESRNIITSSEVTAAVLAQRKPGFGYFAIGADGLHQTLAQYGRADTVNADFVVVGEGPGISYVALTTAINLILQQQAVLVSTNPDNTVDASDANGRHQVLPGGGSLVAPLVAATGVQPLTIGKPEPLLYQAAMDRLGVRAQACLMIGDRPDTDILGAARLGMQTALVRTGRFGVDAVYPQDLPRPDWDCQDLSELSEKLPMLLAPA